MRRIAIVLGAVFCVVGLAVPVFSDEITAESRISEVTVYPGSAVVTRTVSLTVQPGAHTVIFSGLIPDIDENTIKVSTDSEDVKLFGAVLKTQYTEDSPAKKIKELQDEIQNLQDDLKKQENRQQVLAAEREFLQSVRLFSAEQLPKDLVTKVPSPKELQDTLVFVSSQLSENYGKRLESDQLGRQLKKKIEALTQELAGIQSSGSKMTRSIAVEVEARRAHTCTLNLSYLVWGATWTPLYDARADFSKSQVELASYAIVTQTTGEEWQDVKLSVSTARPSTGGRMPYVSPWLLKVFEPRRFEYDREAAAPEGRYQKMAMKAEVMQEEAVEYKKQDALPEPVEKGISVVYVIPRAVSVPPDGSEQKLAISAQGLAANFTYSTYPRLSTVAYLGSRVTNSPQHQLLAGVVNVFLDGDYVGQSSIDMIGPGEEFDLYLGVDENVKISREQVAKKVDDVLIGGIPSPNKVTTISYRLKVENYKTKDISVNLFEAMPVSQDERIKVRIANASLEPQKKDWEDRKGVYKWVFTLKPKEKKEITYQFGVEHGRNLNIEGL